jgi:hypothetical protein
LTFVTTYFSSDYAKAEAQHLSEADLLKSSLEAARDAGTALAGR